MKLPTAPVSDDIRKHLMFLKIFVKYIQLNHSDVEDVVLKFFFLSYFFTFGHEINLVFMAQHNFMANKI